MKLRIYGLITALFILGVLCGILISAGFAKHQIRSITGQSTEATGDLVVKFLDHRLSLKPDQETAIREVLRESEKEILPMRRAFRKQVLGIINTTRPRIAEELDEKQKEELNTIVENLLETWQLQDDPDA